MNDIEAAKLQNDFASLQKQVAEQQEAMTQLVDDVNIIGNCLKGFQPMLVDLRMPPSNQVRRVQIIAREIPGPIILSPSGR